MTAETARKDLRDRLVEAVWDNGMMHCDGPTVVVERVLAVRDAELERLQNQVRDYEDQLVKLGLEGSGYVVVAREDLRAYLNRGTGNLRDEVDALNRLLAAAGIED